MATGGSRRSVDRTCCDLAVLRPEAESDSASPPDCGPSDVHGEYGVLATLNFNENAASDVPW